MERLTKIDKYGHPYTNENVNCRNLISKDGVNYQFVNYENGVKAYDGKPIEKLSKLEDIETDLGIPLEVLFKALKDGIWTNSSKTKREVCLIGDIYNHFCFQDLKYNLYRTKDYGKIWWLEKPKEELGNAKD